MRFSPLAFALFGSLWLGEGLAFVTRQPNSVRWDSQLFARKPFITGNWKLNPQTKDEAISLASDIAEAVTKDSPGDVGLFVPFPFIETVQKIAGDKFVVGAEVCSTLFQILCRVAFKINIVPESILKKGFPMYDFLCS